MGTIPRNRPAEFEVRTFSHFGAIILKPKKLRGHLTLATPTCRKHYFVRGHVGTIPGNTPAKFEVRTFSRFGADRQTDRQTRRGLSSKWAWLMVTWPTCWTYIRHLTPDTRHRRKSENDFIVFTNASASAVHWTDNNVESFWCICIELH